MEISCDSFHAALENGDLATVEAYIKQPHVHAQLVETNEYVIEHTPAQPAFKLGGGENAVYPWYYKPGRDPKYGGFSLGAAAFRGNVHVIEWFFSAERAALMGETMALVLPLVATYDDQASWRLHVKHTDVLEVLLVSPVFRHYMTEGTQRAALAKLISKVTQGDHINVLLAHGAQVDDAIEAVAADAGGSQVDVLFQEGARIVGADALVYCSYRDNVSTARRLLHYGVDWGNTSGAPLLEAARRMSPWNNPVDVYLEHGFLDFDVRDENGMTALMHAASYCPGDHPHFHDNSRDVVWSLIDAGADVNAKDASGCTARYYARYCDNFGVASILEDIGAADEGSDNDSLSEEDSEDDEED